ncbi:WXG100 family type VII secretion target [Nocardioides sp. BGMRC 2183]|nr:WXG100 family type VII secretion target [Nocardioides sp. BGMRC 2183]
MGNIDGLRVNHAALDQAAADIGTTVRKMDERLDRLERELEPLRSQWSGDQQLAYHVAKGKWDGAMNDLRTVLNDSGSTVNVSNAEYAAADRRGANRFMI